MLVWLLSSLAAAIPPDTGFQFDFDGDGWSYLLDCDDSDYTIYPGALEILGDGIDQDCDRREICFDDADDDNARHSFNTRISSDFDCRDPFEAYASDPVDCNDNNAAISPLLSEGIGDGIDQDCNGSELCYGDADNDGARTATSVVSADSDCSDNNEALASAPLDCADSDPTRSPLMSEIAGDGVDQNCDARELCYMDADGDGARTGDLRDSSDADCSDPNEALAQAVFDCNDANATAYPGASELIGDEIDQDCDGGELCWVDSDSDGFRSSSQTVVSSDSDCDDFNEASASSGLDCDDADTSVYPGAYEIQGDGRDQDCDGTEICYVDHDLDGSRDTLTVPSSDPDCADAAEALASAPLDCDDADPTVSPLASELCDEIDNDCDGEVDFADCDIDDLDSDGLLNEDEEALCAAVGMDEALCPADPDMDSDGVIDAVEVTDAANPQDTDGDSHPDFVDADDDGDSLTTRQENGVLCGGDLLPVYNEDGGYWMFECSGVVYDFGGDRLEVYLDTDGDGAPNFRDPDDDGDGVDTAVEWTGDVDCDGLVNYLDANDRDGPCIGETSTSTDTDPGADTDPGTDDIVAPSQPDEPPEQPEPPEDKSQCGCSQSGQVPALLLPLLLLFRRRASSRE